MNLLLENFHKEVGLNEICVGYIFLSYVHCAIVKPFTEVIYERYNWLKFESEPGKMKEIGL